MIKRLWLVLKLIVKDIWRIRFAINMVCAITVVFSIAVNGMLNDTNRYRPKFTEGSISYYIVVIPFLIIMLNLLTSTVEFIIYSIRGTTKYFQKKWKMTA